MTRDPLAPLRALLPTAAWLASRGPMRAHWLRDCHARALADSGGPPTRRAWASVAGCSVAAISAARAEHPSLARLEVARVGNPAFQTQPDSRRSRRAKKPAR